MKILLLLVLLVPATLLHGFVFSELWRWFIVPLGVSPISVVTGMGLRIMVNSFRKNTDTSESVNSYDKIMKDFAETVVLALLAWGLGYIIYLFK